MSNEITEVKVMHVEGTNFPSFIPAGMDSKELFNMTQNTDQVQELAKSGDVFKIIGMIPEMREVEEKDDKDKPTGEMVWREMVTLITTAGTFHSYSKTLNGSLKKAYNIFGITEFPGLDWKIAIVSKGMKQLYNVELV